MTQAQMEREVSNVTGETVEEIRHRGFQLLVMPDRDPLTIDWDEEVEPLRYIPRQSLRRRQAA